MVLLQAALPGVEPSIHGNILNVIYEAKVKTRLGPKSLLFEERFYL
jgi:hypothetical protein